MRIPRFEEILRQFARRTIFNIHIKSNWATEDEREDLYYDVETFRTIVRLLDAYDCRDHAYIVGWPRCAAHRLGNRAGYPPLLCRRRRDP